MKDSYFELIIRHKGKEKKLAMPDVKLRTLFRLMYPEVEILKSRGPRKLMSLQDVVLTGRFLDANFPEFYQIWFKKL